MSSTGTVKFFNAEKNYGFIIPEDGTRNVYVSGAHVRDVEAHGHLQAGQGVAFEIQMEQLGPSARQVRRLSQPAAAAEPGAGVPAPAKREPRGTPGQRSGRGKSSAPIGDSWTPVDKKGVRHGKVAVLVNGGGKIKPLGSDPLLDWPAQFSRVHAHEAGYLTEGADVEFTLYQRDNAPQARDVRLRATLESSLPLPTDTRSAVSRHLQADGRLRIGKGFESPFLALNRMLYLLDAISLDKDRTITEEGKNKHSVLQAICTAFNERERGPFAETFTRLGAAREANARTARSLQEGGYTVVEFQAEVVWRAVIGIGGATPWETGLTLHDPLGVPYLPTSALHGMVRVGARRRAVSEEQLEATMGTTEQRGKLLFLAALPEEHTVSLELDVMTPHHSAYYAGEGRALPLETALNPIPVPFLTIGRGTRFTGYLCARPEHWIHLRRAMRWLRVALERNGVGAKTGAGYGEMKVMRKPLGGPRAARASESCDSDV